MVYLFYTTYISADLAHHEICNAKVGKGGIKDHISKNGIYGKANHSWHLKHWCIKCEIDRY